MENGIFKYIPILVEQSEISIFTLLQDDWYTHMYMEGNINNDIEELHISTFSIFHF